METLKILEKRENLNWEYDDDDADVLYISIGEPTPAEGFAHNRNEKFLGDYYLLSK